MPGDDRRRLDCAGSLPGESLATGMIRLGLMISPLGLQRAQRTGWAYFSGCGFLIRPPRKPAGRPCGQYYRSSQIILSDCWRCCRASYTRVFEIGHIMAIQAAADAADGAAEMNDATPKSLLEPFV